jgi:hypothetical protein
MAPVSLHSTPVSLGDQRTRSADVAPWACGPASYLDAALLTYVTDNRRCPASLKQLSTLTLLCPVQPAGLVTFCLVRQPRPSAEVCARAGRRLDALRAITPHSERSNTATFLEEARAYVESLQKRVAELEYALRVCGAGRGAMPAAQPLPAAQAGASAPAPAPATCFQPQASLPAAAQQQRLAAQTILLAYQPQFGAPPGAPAGALARAPSGPLGPSGAPCNACGAAAQQGGAAGGVGSGAGGLGTGLAQPAGEPGTPPAVSGTGSGGEAAGGVAAGASLDTSSEDSGMPIKKRRLQ